jgi:hypothetical protein
MKPKTMVGRVSRDYATHKTLPNEVKLANVEAYVRQFFWSGPVYVHNREQLANNMYPYPEFFAAGWYVRKEGSEAKQTILVTHGNSLIDARNQLNAQASKIDWG